MYLVTVYNISSEMGYYFETEAEAKAFRHGIEISSAGTKNEDIITIKITKITKEEETSE